MIRLGQSALALLEPFNQLVIAGDRGGLLIFGGELLMVGGLVVAFAME